MIDWFVNHKTGMRESALGFRIERDELRRLWWLTAPGINPAGAYRCETLLEAMEQAEALVEEHQPRFAGLRAFATFANRAGLERCYAERITELGLCEICKAKLNELQAGWARRNLQPATCSTACSQKRTIRDYACCEQAEFLPCVCMYSFTCKVHGERHIGTHD